MAGFRNLALFQAQQRVPPTHEYYLMDLVEIAGLAAVVRDIVDEVTLPASPSSRDPRRTFERAVRDQRPDLVGISSFTCGIKSALEHAEIAKRNGAVVVLGGYHPTARPDDLLQSPFVDLVVRGEGEQTFRELVASGSPEGVDGVSFIRDGEVVHNPDRALITDLDALPRPLRDLRPERFGLTGLDYHTDTIFTSRGCPARCTFCANNLVGKAWRKRSIDSIVEELETIPPPVRGPWKYVKFWDSNFMTEFERIEELCEKIIERGLQRHFRFIAETRASDIVRGRAILPKMREAGFVRMGCGVESPNKETHKKLKKGLNLGHVQQAAEHLAAADIHFTKFLIIGHPEETEGDILGYPDYSLGHGTHLQGTTFFVMTPYPGTVLGDQYEEQGLVKSHDWDLYTNFCSVVEPHGMSTQKMQSLLCAVSLRYGIYRRFLRDKSFSSSLGRLFESLLTHSRIGLLHPDHTRREVERGVFEALVASAGSKSRPRSGVSGRDFAERFAVRFHSEDGRSVVVGSVLSGAEESLVIQSGHARLEGASAKKEIHISIPQLVGYVDNLPHQSLVSDAMTLKHNARAFRLRWLPSLVWQIGKLGVKTLRMAGFHFATALSGWRRERGKVVPFEIPRPSEAAQRDERPEAPGSSSAARVADEESVKVS